MSSEAVDKFVHNPSRIDKMTPLIQEMGANDLALCLVLLGRELRAARAEGNTRLGGLLVDRLGRVERELERRQLQIDDLLA